MAFITALTAAIFGAGTFLAVTSAFVLKAAVAIGLSYAAQALAGKPKQQSSAQQPFSVQGRIRASGEVPRSFMVGKGSTAGSLVYAHSWGEANKTPNSHNVQVIALSDLPCQSLDQVWVNGELCTLDGTPHADFGSPVLEYRKSGTDYLWVKFYDGTQTTADAYLVSKFGSDALRPYASTRVGTGIAYAICTSRVQEELFAGFPEFKFALTGRALYDPTQDDTAGGTGDQRWNTPATWGGDGDHLPIVQLYNILRGISYGTEWFYGLQNISAAQLPNAAWIAAINVCRAHVDGPSGEEDQYRSGGEIPVNARIADTVEALLTSCQGRLAEIGGFYKPHAGAPGSSVGSFTDGDIVSLAGQSFTPFYGLADTINGIAAKYPEPAEGWNVKPAPTRYDTDFEAEDGNRRLMADVDYSMVPYGGQVQRLMQSALDEARRARRHTFVLPAEFWRHEPNDVLTWTSERNGYAAKLFRIDGMADLANLDVMVDLTEVDPADYDWNQETDFVSPVDGRVGIARPVPQPIVDWFAEGFILVDASANPRRPAIRLSWDGEVDDVEAVQFQVRMPGSPATVVRDGATQDVAKAAVVISESLLSNTLYEVRGRYIPRSDRPTLWSNETFGGSPPATIEGAWFEVTTPNVGITEDDLAASIQMLLQRVDEMSGDLRIMRNRLAQIGHAQIDQNYLLEEYKGQVWRGLGSRYGENKASVDRVDTVLTTTRSALAQMFGAAFASTEAGEAESLFRVSALSDLDAGVLAHILLQVRAGQGSDVYGTAALELLAMFTTELGTHTRAILAADQIDLKLSGGVVLPARGLRAAGEAYPTPIVAGTPNTVQVDLRTKRTSFFTELTADVKVLYPLGAAPGDYWIHIFEQDGTGNRTVDFDYQAYILSDPVVSVLGTAGSFTFLLGVIGTAVPPRAAMTRLQAGVTIAGSVRAFSIDPPIGGKSIWELAIDGPLTINGPYTGTLVPLGERLDCNIVMWGPGGSTAGISTWPTTNAATDASPAELRNQATEAVIMRAVHGKRGPATVQNGPGSTPGGIKGTGGIGDTLSDGEDGGSATVFFDGGTNNYVTGYGGRAGNPDGGARRGGYHHITAELTYVDALPGNAPGGGANGAQTVNGPFPGGGGGERAESNFDNTTPTVLSEGTRYDIIVPDSGNAGIGTNASGAKGAAARVVIT